MLSAKFNLHQNTPQSKKWGWKINLEGPYKAVCSNQKPALNWNARRLCCISQFSNSGFMTRFQLFLHCPCTEFCFCSSPILPQCGEVFCCAYMQQYIGRFISCPHYFILLSSCVIFKLNLKYIWKSLSNLCASAHKNLLRRESLFISGKQLVMIVLKCIQKWKQLML